MTNGSRVDGLALICYGSSPDRQSLIKVRAKVSRNRECTRRIKEMKTAHLWNRLYTYRLMASCIFLFASPFIYSNHVFYTS